MTAASGLVHEEFHGQDFGRRGGPFEMVQLWVNLPARDKMSPPRYQGITTDEIPVVELADGQGSVRVIAGAYAGVDGPARTFTPIHVWDVRFDAGRQTELTVPDGYTTVLVVLRGAPSRKRLRGYHRGGSRTLRPRALSDTPRERREDDGASSLGRTD